MLLESIKPTFWNGAVTKESFFIMHNIFFNFILYRYHGNIKLIVFALNAHLKNVHMWSGAIKWVSVKTFFRCSILCFLCPPVVFAHKHIQNYLHNIENCNERKYNRIWRWNFRWKSDMIYNVRNSHRIMLKSHISAEKNIFEKLFL